MLISLEGVDGSGKSTLLEGLARALRSRGLEVVTTREPGGCKLAEEVRQILLHKESSLSNDAELLLFLAARSEHLFEIIRPALAQGKIVLCDRFNDSTLAYQGYGRGLNLERVRTLTQLACDGLEPDITFLLDLPPAIGLARRSAQRDFDRFELEKESFRERVRSGFLEIARLNPERVHVLDATLAKDVLVEKALQWIV